MPVKVIVREEAKRRLRAIFANLAKRSGHFVVSRVRPSFWKMRTQLTSALRGKVSTWGFKQRPIAGGAHIHENLPSSLQMRGALYKLSKYQQTIPFRRFLPAKEQAKEEMKDILVRKFSTEAYPGEGSQLLKKLSKVKPLEVERHVEDLADKFADWAATSSTKAIMKLHRPALQKIRPYIFGGPGHRGIFPPLERKIKGIQFDRKLRAALQRKYGRRVRERSALLDRQLQTEIEKMRRM